MSVIRRLCRLVKIDEDIMWCGYPECPQKSLLSLRMCVCVCVFMKCRQSVGVTSAHRSASRSCWQRSSVNSDLLTHPQRAEDHGKTGGEDREGKDQRGEKKRRRIRGNMKVEVKSLGENMEEKSQRGRAKNKNRRKYGTFWSEEWEMVRRQEVEEGEVEKEGVGKVTRNIIRLNPKGRKPQEKQRSNWGQTD